MPYPLFWGCNIPKKYKKELDRWLSDLIYDWDIDFKCMFVKKTDCDINELSEKF